MLQFELNLWTQVHEAETASTAIAFEQRSLCFETKLRGISALENGS